MLCGPQCLSPKAGLTHLISIALRYRAQTSGLELHPGVPDCSQPGSQVAGRVDRTGALVILWLEDLQALDMALFNKLIGAKLQAVPGAL